MISDDVLIMHGLTAYYEHQVKRKLSERKTRSLLAVSDLMIQEIDELLCPFHEWTLRTSPISSSIIKMINEP